VDVAQDLGLKDSALGSFGAGDARSWRGYKEYEQVSVHSVPCRQLTPATFPIKVLLD